MTTKRTYNHAGTLYVPLHTIGHTGRVPLQKTALFLCTRLHLKFKKITTPTSIAIFVIPSHFNLFADPQGIRCHRAQYRSVCCAACTRCHPSNRQDQRNGTCTPSRTASRASGNHVKLPKFPHATGEVLSFSNSCAIWKPSEGLAQTPLGRWWRSSVSRATLSLKTHHPSTQAETDPKIFLVCCFLLVSLSELCRTEDKTVGPSSHTTAVGLRCVVYTRSEVPRNPRCQNWCVCGGKKPNILGATQNKLRCRPSLFYCATQPEIFDVWFLFLRSVQIVQIRQRADAERGRTPGRGWSGGKKCCGRCPSSWR